MDRISVICTNGNYFTELKNVDEQELCEYDDWLC